MKNIVVYIILLLSINSHLMAEEKRPQEIERINNFKPIHKGEYLIGISASHGSASSSNSEFYLILEGVDAEGSATSAKPFFGYFYSDNGLLGARFKYTELDATLSSADIDLGNDNDLSLEIPYVDLSSKSYAYGIFHRSYAKLDKKGQFELFSEVELSYSHGKTSITQDFTSEKLTTVTSKTYNCSLNFSPGLNVYIFPNVSSFVSFGLGGLSYNNIRQYDENNNFIGKRNASRLSLNLNVFAINFGMAVHLW